MVEVSLLGPFCWSAALATAKGQNVEMEHRHEGEQQRQQFSGPISRDDQDISNDDDIMIMNALQGSEVWIPIPLGLVLHFIERALVMSFPPNLNPTCALSTSNFLTPLQFESKTTHKQSQTHLQRTCVCSCKYVYNDTYIFNKIGI